MMRAIRFFLRPFRRAFSFIRSHLVARLYTKTILKRKQATWLYFGNLGKDEPQYQAPQFIGLALNPQHKREILHDAMQPLPFATNSIEKVQSQDVFEHIPYENVAQIFDEIYRVLQPGGLFRLSLPDYRSPLLKQRCVYDYQGNVLADIMVGGNVAYSYASNQLQVHFAPNGEAHVWFPTYELVQTLIEHSALKKCAKIKFYQGFISDAEWLTENIPDKNLFVSRALPHDTRAQGKPISLVVDFWR